MKKRITKVGKCCITLMMLVALLGGAQHSTAAGDITFPPTGQTLSDAHGFLSYWQAHGGLAQFGYPISPEAVEVSPTDGRQYITQWFERNRFEYHPENSDPQYRVLLGLLGHNLALGREGQPPFLPTIDPQNGICLYFAPTSHTLCHSFRAYWEQHGGLAIFGYPISEEFQEQSTDGKTYIVQYFERNRFEYHPENKGTPYEVLLGLLGVQIGGFPFAATPNADTSTPLIVPDKFKSNPKWQIPHNLTGAAGMQISLFGTSPGPRMMAVAPNGDLFVSDTRTGQVFVMPDRAHTGVAEESKVFVAGVTGMEKPHGLAFHSGYLYVASEKAVFRFPYTDGQLSTTADKAQKIADLPYGPSHDLANGVNHDTRSLTFGPDGKIYVSIGSDCDLCEGDTRRAKIMQFNDDGSGGRVFASGLRNAVGLDFDPRTGLLWASVNERNKEGNDFPPDYLTPIRDGGDYGWPYCVGKPPQPDPKFGKSADFCASKDTGAADIPAHMAPLGIRFYEGGANLPKGYEDGIFVAAHGSQERQPAYGYEVRFVSLRPGQMAHGSQVVITGWLVNGQYWGRPVDVVFGKDGAMYISDDAGGAVYRVTFH